MSLTNLRLVGYCALLNALITLPVFFYLAFLEVNKRAASSGLQLVMISVVCTAISVFLMTSLRKYIFMKTGVDSIKYPIIYLIYGYFLVFALNVFTTFFPLDEKVTIILTILSVFALGALQAYLGVCLFRLEDNLNGFRKAYSILLGVTGILSASVVLFPISLFSSAVSDIMLGTIFLQAAKEIVAASQSQG